MGWYGNNRKGGASMVKRKKRAIVLVTGLLAAAIGFSAIYATTKPENTATNVVTIGNVKIELHNQDDEAVNSGSKTVLPGEHISKVVSVENVGDYAAYIRLKLKKEWENNSVSKPLSEASIVPLLESGWTKGETDPAETASGYEYYYYKDIVAATSVNIPFMNEFQIDAASIDSDTLDANTSAVGKISIEADAIQADYYTPTKDGSGNIIAWPDVSFGASFVNSTPVATVVTQAAITTGSSVEFVGNSHEFVSFETGTDLFLNVKGIMPGQTVTQDISIKNIYDTPVKVYMYAKIPDEYIDLARTDTEWELLKELQLVVTSSAIGESGHNIYTGSLFEDNPSKDMLSKEKAIMLGNFFKGQNYKVEAAITLPGTWKKAYCQTKIDWVFVTNKLTTPIPYIPPEAPIPVIPTPLATKQTPVVMETPVIIEQPDVEETILPTVTPNIEVEETIFPSASFVPTLLPDVSFTPEPIITEESVPSPMVTASISKPDSLEEQIQEIPKSPEGKEPVEKPVPDIPKEYATKTGDSTPIWFWRTVFLVSFVLGIYNGIVLLKIKKKNRKD